MEVFTLSVTVAVSTFVMAVTAFSLYLFSNKRTDSYLLDWTLSSVCFFTYGILSVALVAGKLDSSIVPILPNTLFLTGHAAVLSGIFKLTGKEPTWRIVLLTAIGSAIFHSIPAVIESFMLRAYVLYPFLISIYGTALFALWKDRKSPYKRAYIPLAIVFAFYILQSLLRSFIAVAEDIAMEFLGNDIIQTSGTLAIIILFFSLTVCFALTVSWRKEIDLRKKAVTDHLTGWLNRATLEVTAAGVLNECKRNNTQSAFILLDIDNFKAINDQYGHAVGDRSIQHVCEITAEKLRNYDPCFRLGGEEFLIIVKDTTAATSEKLAERIRQAVEQTPLRFEEKTINLTVSIGIALSQPDTSWSALLDNADKALYVAKNNGRNKVVEHNIAALPQLAESHK